MTDDKLKATPDIVVKQKLRHAYLCTNRSCRRYTEGNGVLVTGVCMFCEARTNLVASVKVDS